MPPFAIPKSPLISMDNDFNEHQNSSSWHVIGAAVRGVSHEKNDLPCQDAQGYRLLPGGILLAALADGAGSASQSDQGASLAVDRLLEFLEASLSMELPIGAEGWRSLIEEAFGHSRQELLSLAEADGLPGREFATTLTGVIAVDGCLVVGQLGDGAAVAGNLEGLFSASTVQRGEYANETFFLTQDDALDHLDVQVIERPVRLLALFSDGLMRLALRLPGYEPHLPFFRPLFEFAAAADDGEQAAGSLAEFLASDRVNARTDDDKSLVLAVRVEG